VKANDQEIVDRALAMDRYEKGFHDGADPQRARRRRTVEPSMLKFQMHYMRGYVDGRRAAEEHERAYRDELARLAERKTPPDPEAA
jgi:hypothetical protein